MANKKHLHKNDWNRTVFIDSLDVETTDFDLADTQVKALIKSGIKGVSDHFNWRNKNFNDKPR